MVIDLTRAIQHNCKVKQRRPSEHRKLYIYHPDVQPEVWLELSGWVDRFVEKSNDKSRLPDQQRAARSLTKFADWAFQEFELASELVRCLQIEESAKCEIAGLQSWIDEDRSGSEEERLHEGLRFAQLRIDDLSEQLPQFENDHACARSKHIEYCYSNQFSLEELCSYASAMDLLNDIASDSAIRQRLATAGSTKFELPPPEPASLTVLLSPEEYTEEDFLEILRDLEAESGQRRAHEPVSDSTPDRQDLSPTNSTKAADTAAQKAQSKQVEASDVPLPDMKFITGQQRHKAVDDFIDYIFATTGKHISRRDIWKVRKLATGEKGGYPFKATFNDWQRGEGSKKSAKYFEAILRLKIRIW